MKKMKPFNAKVEICSDVQNRIKITFFNVDSKDVNSRQFKVNNVKVHSNPDHVIFQISDGKGGAVLEGKEEAVIYTSFEDSNIKKGLYAFFINDDSSLEEVVTPKQTGTGGVVGLITCGG
ncbi:hypothetical protein [Olleya sp. ITB9]|uniref:hypothetical protein n=1 Tax=Olleya sp. ITB9 TaxID=1715648 RepID=UPI0011DF3CCF|nr:hypothetical protein [Olleya sp. ITB9]